MKSELTKSQRHTAYIIMLVELQLRMTHSRLQHGLCDISQTLFDIDPDSDLQFGNMRKYFPELWKHRAGGKVHHSIWLWNNNYERVEALEAGIKETV
jgi:hypothetical protein